MSAPLTASLAGASVGLAWRNLVAHTASAETLPFMALVAALPIGAGFSVARGPRIQRSIFWIGSSFNGWLTLIALIRLEVDPGEIGLFINLFLSMVLLGSSLPHIVLVECPQQEALSFGLVSGCATEAILSGDITILKYMLSIAMGVVGAVGLLQDLRPADPVAESAVTPFMPKTITRQRQYSPSFLLARRVCVKTVPARMLIRVAARENKANEKKKQIATMSKNQKQKVANAENQREHPHPNVEVIDNGVRNAASPVTASAVNVSKSHAIMELRDVISPQDCGRGTDEQEGESDEQESDEQPAGRYGAVKKLSAVADEKVPAESSRYAVSPLKAVGEWESNTRQPTRTDGNVCDTNTDWQYNAKEQLRGSSCHLTTNLKPVTAWQDDVEQSQVRSFASTNRVDSADWQHDIKQLQAGSSAVASHVDSADWQNDIKQLRASSSAATNHVDTVDWQHDGEQLHASTCGVTTLNTADWQHAGDQLPASSCGGTTRNSADWQHEGEQLHASSCGVTTLNTADWQHDGEQRQASSCGVAATLDTVADWQHHIRNPHGQSRGDPALDGRRDQGGPMVVWPERGWLHSPSGGPALLREEHVEWAGRCPAVSSTAGQPWNSRQDFESRPGYATSPVARCSQELAHSVNGHKSSFNYDAAAFVPGLGLLTERIHASDLRAEAVEFNPSSGVHLAHPSGVHLSHPSGVLPVHPAVHPARDRHPAQYDIASSSQAGGESDAPGANFGACRANYCDPSRNAYDDYRANNVEYRNGYGANKVEFKNGYDVDAAEFENKYIINATVPKNECDVDAIDFANGYNVNAAELKNGYNANAAELKNGYNVNAAEFKNGYNVNAAEFKNGYNVNAAEFKNGYNVNAAEFKNGYNVNAAEFKNGYNVNAAEFNNGYSVNATEFKNGYNVNAAEFKNGYNVNAAEFKNDDSTFEKHHADVWPEVKHYDWYPAANEFYNHKSHEQYEPFDPEKRVWAYRDPKGRAHRAFSSTKMSQWYEAGFFHDGHQVAYVPREDSEIKWAPLLEYFPLSQPFSSWPNSIR